MKRKFLEDLKLEKEVIDKIMAENGTDIEAEKKKAENAMAELETARKTITERDGQLEELKKSGGDAETLKKQIETLQADNKKQSETHKAEIKQLKLDAAIESALTGAKAKNITAAKALLKDLDKAEFAEDGSVKGLKEQIDTLVKSKDSGFLFESSKQKPTIKGAHVGEPGKEDPDGEVDLSKMSYEEIASYMDQNPDTQI